MKIIFSTDPNPSNSKSKCVYMCGKENVVYPKKLSLHGKELPYVKHANHLGHELSQTCTMDQDIRIKKAKLIDASTEIRETFGFAEPTQVLKAIRVYAGHYYGAMLWDLKSDLCGQYCRVWNTSVKMVHIVPRSCHTYLVQNVLAPEFLPVKTELMARYANFYRNISNSACFELCLLAKTVSMDVRSTTRRNLSLIENETSLDPCIASPQEVKSSVKLCETPRNQDWRVNQLQTLLMERREKNSIMEDTSINSHMNDSLCSS